jgi:hypothetical protein
MNTLAILPIARHDIRTKSQGMLWAIRALLMPEMAFVSNKRA